MRRIAVALLLVGLCTVACRRYRPALYVDQPPVTRVADDRPIPVPPRTKIPEAVYISEIYLRRPIIDALDPKRTPRAGDVNSWDEVPRSSWFWPVEDVFETYEADGPAEPPFTVVPGKNRTRKGGLRVRDARGKLYELHRDEPRLPETSTAATAIASRLLRAIGYRTPEVYVQAIRAADIGGAPRMTAAFLDVGPPPERDYYRITATRWPVGIDLGETRTSRTRSDDPNDQIDHRDRRSLRALKVVAAWLDARRFGPKNTRDAYVGPAGLGHVKHFLVGFHDALGVSELAREKKKRELAVGDVEGGFGKNLVTLGLRRSQPKRQGATSLSGFDAELDAKTFELRLPYEPAERLHREDAYWAAKRIAQLPAHVIGWAVDSAMLSSPEIRLNVTLTLLARRRQLAAHWFTRVSPVELVRVEPEAIVVRDEAVQLGVLPVESVVYEIRLLDATGWSFAGTQHVTPSGAEFSMIVPKAACEIAKNYIIVRARAFQSSRRANNAAEFHVVCRGAKRRVIAVRH